MATFTIVRETDTYEGAEPESYLSIESGRKRKGKVAREEVSVDELIQLLDDDAEGANYHQFVGFAQTLADNVRVQYAESTSADDLARRVLWAIAERGGFTEGA